MALTGYANTAPGPIFTSDASPTTNIGSRFKDTFGNEYVYVKAGGVALVQGKLQQAPAEVTTHQNLVLAATAGAFTATVTLGATNDVAANQYAGGTIVMTSGTGAGYKYTILSHPAASALATLVVTLEQAIQVTAASTPKADLVSNPYTGVIVNPTTATSAAIGVGVYPVGINLWGWIQTSGVAAILVDDQTVVVGTNVAASNQAAGGIEPATGVQSAVGTAMTGGATTEYVGVLLRLS